MSKPRHHNEWFRCCTSMAKCPGCGASTRPRSADYRPNTEVWAWGEYVNAKWRTVLHFCNHCYASRVASTLTAHVSQCGCHVTLIGKGRALPEWISIDEKRPV